MTVVYPEELLHKRVAELEAELETSKIGYDAAMRIIKAVFPSEFPGNYFITGEVGAKDINNMPNKILVCPAMGLDFSYIYEYTGETTGCEW